MWLFGGSSSSTRDANAAEDEAALREEAEELRLKFEALRMAEYRQEQRIACGREVPPSGDSDNFNIDQLRGASTACGSRAVAEAPGTSLKQPAQHFSMDESSSGSPSRGNDLESMYDFSRLATSSSHQGEEGLRPGQCSGQDLDTDEADDGEESKLQQLTLAEAGLRAREQELQALAVVQEKKLVAASHTLQRTRVQLHALTDQLETKGQSSESVGSHADALQMLLAEKERRLTAALNEASSALEGTGEESVVKAAREPTQQNEEQLLQLAAMTEELTDALEQARDSEEEVLKQLTGVAVRAQQERQQRLLYEQELASAGREQHAEITALRSHLQKQEQILAWERARLKELETAAKQSGGDWIIKAVFGTDYEDMSPEKDPSSVF